MDYLKNSQKRLKERYANPPKPQPQLPNAVRDYFENVRGNTAALQAVTPVYVDLLWKAAHEHATKHKVPQPIHEEELLHLRAYAMVRFPEAAPC